MYGIDVVVNFCLICARFGYGGREYIGVACCSITLGLMGEIDIYIHVYISPTSREVRPIPGPQQQQV